MVTPGHRRIVAACDWCDRRRELHEVAGELVCGECIDGRGSTRRTVAANPDQADLFPLPEEHTT